MAQSPIARSDEDVDPQDETSTAAPRVGHKKSRNGCAQCKRRHVKCNEAKPCSNCVRHNVACSLAGGPNVTRDDLKNRRSPTESSASRKESTESDVIGVEYRGSSPLRRLTQTLDRRRSGEAWMSDLQLMHHFDNHAHELMGEVDLAEIWRQDVPQLAFSSQYVMHILLGISALHLAYQQPQRAPGLRMSAVSHLDQALTHYRQDDAPVSAENAEQRFCFSFLVCLFAYAIPVTITPIDALCEVFALVQGVDVVANETFSWIVTGPFAPMINRSLQEVMRTTPDNHVVIPAGLEIGINHLDYMLDQSLTPEENATLAVALQDLKLVYSNVLQAGSATGIGLIICWPKIDSGAFCTMLKCRVQQALVLLAYYCVLLDLLDHKWYLKGWGSRVLQNVVAHLDDSWKPWVRWPVNTVLLKASPAAGLTSDLEDSAKMMY